jgi:hypothetical protein
MDNIGGTSLRMDGVTPLFRIFRLFRTLSVHL